MTPHRLKEIEHLCSSPNTVLASELSGATQELLGELHRLRSQLKLTKPKEIKCWKCGQEMPEGDSTCGNSAVIVGCQLSKYRSTYKIHLCHSCHSALYNSDAEGIF